MPFDANGTFNRVIVGGWQADAAAGTKITALRHDNEDDGFATGLSTCITKDGRTQPTANIPMNNKKIIDLAEPTQPDDAATKNYVDKFKSFTTGIIIAGAGPINGFINFTSPTGVNGIGWTSADMSWIGRAAVASQYTKRLAVNNSASGTGADVFAIDESGRVTSFGMFANNLVWDSVAWRAPIAGIATLMQISGGQFTLQANDAATAAAYLTPAMREFFSVENSAGSPLATLNKSASGKVAGLIGSMAAKRRWLMYLGDATAETATDKVGSNFALYSYDNAGTGLTTVLQISRQTNLITAYGALTVAGNLTTAGTLTFDGILQSTVATTILASTASGAIYLRPNGAGSTVEQTYLDSAGDFHISNDLTVGEAAPASYGVKAGAGVMGKVGSNGAYGTLYNNFNWDGVHMAAYAGTNALGWVAWQCDYRIKKNVRPLPSLWEKVKALNPISYQQKAYDIWIDDDTVRWGFIAHELQEKLDPSAASGCKDGEDIQSPDLMGVLAGVTRALQEAMARIEALEVKALAA